VDRIDDGSSDLLGLVRRVKTRPKVSCGTGISDGRHDCNLGEPMDDSSIIRVLLVDDSPQLFFFYQRYLEKNGCGCECNEMVGPCGLEPQTSTVSKLRHYVLPIT
jgi:hypothetical protein